MRRINKAIIAAFCLLLVIGLAAKIVALKQENVQVELLQRGEWGLGETPIYINEDGPAGVPALTVLIGHSRKLGFLRMTTFTKDWVDGKY